MFLDWDKISFFDFDKIRFFETTFFGWWMLAPIFVGATTLALMTFSITTRSIVGLMASLNINNIYDNAMLKVIFLLLCWVSLCSVLRFYHCNKCRIINVIVILNDVMLSVDMISAVMLIVIMHNVVMPIVAASLGFWHRQRIEVDSACHFPDWTKIESNENGSVWDWLYNYVYCCHRNLW